MYTKDDYEHDLSSYHTYYCTNEVPYYINENEFFRIYASVRKRKKAYKKFLMSLLNKYDKVYFITLTFSDEFLPKTEVLAVALLKKLFRGIKLKNSNFMYRFNVDYGGKFGRLHFHGVTNFDFTTLWNYGFFNVQEVFLNYKDISKITSYVNKVVNHSFKSGTSTLIYSRRKKNG